MGGKRVARRIKAGRPDPWVLQQGGDAHLHPQGQGGGGWGEMAALPVLAGLQHTTILWASRFHSTRM